MNSLTSQFLDNINIDSKLAANLRLLGEYKGRQFLYQKQSPESLDTLRKLAIIESAESSNRIEGIYVKRDRIKAIIDRNTSPVGRSEQEVTGYRDALALIHEKWQDLPFNIHVIKQLHTMMYRYIPGEHGGDWKRTQNEIIERYPDGTERIRFKPVSVSSTPGFMKGLVEGYRTSINEGRDPLLIIPLTILDFLCIHTFLDGNGRMARLLTLHLLYKAGYEVGRYISLERIFEDTKESYYDTLERSSSGWHEGEHDVMPWLTYFWGVLIRSFRDFEERVGVVTTGRGAKTEQIELAVKRKLGPFSISDIENECPGISRDMIRRILRRMRDEGLIRSTGTGRGAKWIKMNEWI